MLNLFFVYIYFSQQYLVLDTDATKHGQLVSPREFMGCMAVVVAGDKPFTSTIRGNILMEYCWCRLEFFCKFC